MKPTAYLVDTSRPDVVDKAALASALRVGGIAGAALDVHDPIPLAPDDPLAKLDNVLLTPWSAAFAEDSVEKMSMAAAKNAIEVLRGRAPLHRLNEVTLPPL